MAIVLTTLGSGSNDASAHSPHDDIADIAVSPSYGERGAIYVISRGRLQRSTNDGATWTDLVRGFGPAPLARVVVSSTVEDLIFATSRGNGLFRSTDGGATWATANEGLDNLRLQEVAVSPESAAVVLVAGGAGGGGGLHRSSDGGDTWSRVEGFEVVEALSFLQDGSGRVVAGDSSGRLALSEDDGATWEDVEPSRGVAVTALAAAPAGVTGADVVAASADGRVLRSTDGGSSFETVHDDAPGDVPRAIAISAEDPTVLWLSTASEGAFRSTDSGATWEQRSIGLTKAPQADEVGVPHFRALRVAASDDKETLLLAGFDGLFRSTDGGQRWNPVETTADYLAGLAVSPDFANDQTVVAMGYVKGGFISHDAGETWETMNEGLRFEGLSEGNRLLPLRRAHNVVFSPDFAEDRTIFSAIWPRLIKSVDAGETWTEVQIEAPTEDWSGLRQYVLAVSPDYGTDQTVFAGNRHGQILRSTGAGDAGTWSQIASVEGRVRTFAISPTFGDDGVLFVSTVDGVFKSEDGGTSWRSTGLGQSPIAVGGELDPAPMLSISPDYATDGVVFAGTDSGLFVTRDGGGSWSEIVSGPITDTTDVAAVSVSPDYAADGTVLVSVVRQGLYRSTDGGATFSEVGRELIGAGLVIADYDNPTSKPIQMSQTYATDRTVFAMAGSSVVRSSDGGESWNVLALPTIADVAASLGVEVDALNRQGEPPDDDRGGRRTFQTPLGTMSVRRLAVSAAVAGLAAVLLTVARVGQGRPMVRRWGVRAGASLVVFVGAAAVLAA